MSVSVERGIEDHTVKREYLCVNYPLQCVMIEEPAKLIIVKQAIIVPTILMTAMTCASMEGPV